MEAGITSDTRKKEKRDLAVKGGSFVNHACVTIHDVDRWLSRRETNSEQSEAKAPAVMPNEVKHSIAQSKESNSAWSGERLLRELLRPMCEMMSESSKTQPCPLRLSSKCQEASSWHSDNRGDKARFSAGRTGISGSTSSFESAFFQTEASLSAKSRVSKGGSLTFSKMKRLRLFHIYQSIHGKSSNTSSSIPKSRPLQKRKSKL